MRAEAPGALATPAMSFIAGFIIVLVYGWMVIDALPDP